MNRPGRMWTAAVAVAVALALAIALARPGPAAADLPSAVPQAVWWRAQSERALSTDPLEAMRAPATLEAGAEWAPLYRGPDGARFERSRRTVRVLTAPGRVRAAAEIGSLGTLARGGGGPWWIGTERSGAIDGAAGLAGFFGRLAAGCATGTADGRLGLTASSRATLAPAVSTSLGWSRWPGGGRATVRWEETNVLASGRWTDERFRWSIDFAARGVQASLRQESLARRAVGGSPGDRLDPSLDWHGSALTLAAPVPGARLSASLDAGVGHEALRVWRGGTHYARMGGPVRQSLGEFLLEPRRGQVRLRAWVGRWSSQVRGDLALWPFDDLAAVFGSRRGVQAGASLAHHGVALERKRSDRARFEGGLGLWRLRPRADYQSWQAPALGLGRLDESTGSATLREATLLGVRLAVAGGGALRARLEVVQWLPLRVTTESLAPSAGDGESGGPGTTGGPATGGTVLRLSIVGTP